MENKRGIPIPTMLAEELNLKPIQVRKDISFTGLEGKPKVGFDVDKLIDTAEEKWGTSIGDVPIYPFNQLHRYIEENHVNIAVLTVPANEAQHVADRLVALGIMAIWNFAPKDIKVPSRVVLQRTDLATSFAVLSAKVKRVMEHREFNEEEDDLW
jgi:redox-sensing transcriptional repressor